jgi:hypothetical protein
LWISSEAGGETDVGFKGFSANICAICVQGFDSGTRACLAADERRQRQKQKQKQVLPPVRCALSSHRGHRGKAGENLKAWILGLNLKTVFGFRFHRRVKEGC